QQVVMAIDVVVCLSRPGGKRRIVEICELKTIPEGGHCINCLFSFDYRNHKLNKVGELSEITKMQRYSYG
ncbi:MAG: hypothetical protein JXN10_09375, partial [Clostridia bacterium]|nr:hypothetical protein [Clostridia bacterium]